MKKWENNTVTLRLAHGGLGGSRLRLLTIHAGNLDRLYDKMTVEA